jgi:hypothetical protein
MKIIIIAILLFCFGCSSYDLGELDITDLYGTWRSKDDTNYILIIEKDDSLTEMYENEVLDRVSLKWLNNSCDSSYKKSSKEDFYLRWGSDRCVEIVGLSDTVFSFFDSKSGKLNVFSKVQK